MKAETINVTEFKAHCLELFDHLTDGSLDCIEVTRRGKVVAIVKPPASTHEEAMAVLGCMKGMAVISPDVDLTKPILDEPLEAAEGLPQQ